MQKILQRAKTILAELKNRKIVKKEAVENILYKKTGYKTGSQTPANLSEFEAFPKDGFWGGECDSHAWFYFKITAGQNKSGKAEQKNIYTALEITTNCSLESSATSPQFLLYINGKEILGGDNNHFVFPLAEGDYDIFVYGYTGMKIDKKLTFTPHIITVDGDVEQLIYDLEVPVELLEITQKDSLEFSEILSYVNSAINILDLRKTSLHFNLSVIDAKNYLKKAFYEGYCKKTAPTVTCVGHTHIDVAWLWSVEQSKEKAQRSFANMLALMDEYPEFTFISSQPILYKFVKEEAPTLYAKIKEFEKEGRWEVEGGTWLENDCNLISGESFVRQLLYGKKFFKQEFDKDSKILWLPDTFGFPASIPQILIKSGITDFATSKINWNDQNDFPYEVFSWQGIDGSSIDGFIITAQDYTNDFSRYTTYNGEGTPSQVKGTWNRFRQKDLTDNVLLAYGYGDGGGGATREYCEKLKRMEKGIPSCPTVKFGTFTEYFNNLKQRSTYNKKQTWMGELYLEFHRGTYTSMARNKRYNRKAEYLLGNVELFCVMNSLLNGYKYPEEKLLECRELLMLNQFHDILPGSSIREVYEQSDNDYETLFNIANGILDEITIELSQSVTAFNPTSFNFSGDVLTDNEYVYVENVPSLGFRSVLPEVRNSIKTNDYLLENDFLRVAFNTNGTVFSIFDKNQSREILSAGGKGCRIVAYDDYPFNFDAWEIKDYYKEKSYEITEPISSEIVVEGNRTGKKTVYKYLNSIIKQTVWLYQNNRYLDFENEIDWSEEHTILKAEIPLDINCSKATCDIQFGTVERSLAKNTSWDKARFEVCAHKFVDYSEADYGVAVMNDCKYGYSLEYKNMSLTLLKCATSPNENADKGKHYFKYAIYPHIGDYAQSDVGKVSLQYNNPIFIVSKNTLVKEIKDASLVKTDSDNIVIEAVKCSEDGAGFIVRAVEEKCKRTIATFEFMQEIVSAMECDLMENVIDVFKFNGNKLIVDFKPYEIKTIKIKLI